MIGAIGFESEEVQLRKLRERLRLMSDEELIQFGKECRNLVRAKRVSSSPDPCLHKWKQHGRSGGGDSRRFEWMPETTKRYPRRHVQWLQQVRFYGAVS